MQILQLQQLHKNTEDKKRKDDKNWVDFLNKSQKKILHQQICVLILLSFYDVKFQTASIQQNKLGSLLITIKFQVLCALGNSQTLRTNDLSRWKLRLLGNLCFKLVFLCIYFSELYTQAHTKNWKVETLRGEMKQDKRLKLTTSVCLWTPYCSFWCWLLLFVEGLGEFLVLALLMETQLIKQNLQDIVYTEYINPSDWKMHKAWNRRTHLSKHVHWYSYMHTTTQ